MKQVRIAGGAAEVVEVADPRIREDYVLVKVQVAPMCTEFKAVKGGWEDLNPGHEAAGEVVEVARPGRVKPGDRVVVMPQYPCGKCELCRSGDYIHCEHNPDPLKICGSRTGRATYAQYVIKPDWLLIPIPDDMSYEHASMACCGLGPTFGAMQLIDVRASDTVLITGAGPVGLGGIVNARYRGARVIVAEGNPYRAKLARELGAEAVVDPVDPGAADRVRDLTGGRGVDKAVEASGTAASKDLVVRGTRRKGRIAIPGWEGQLNVGDLITKGLEVHGVWHWNLNDTAGIMRVIRDNGPAIDRLVTHSFPIERVREAFALQASGNCGKVLVYPWR